jgi:pimeloyl-ACP methyl ester carboxylesterase
MGAHCINNLVVLLHGILRTNACMAGMARFLEKNGYDVLNINYPSTKLTIEELTEYIHQQLVTYSAARKIHFVGYSMGGLLIRAYLNKHTLDNLGRVVMLGTPNHGSEAADFWKDNWAYKKVFGPAGQQLGTDQSALADVLGKVYYELGIIAGNCSIDPFSFYLIKGENDGKARVSSTKIHGMKDHIILPVSHFFMPQSKVCWQQVLQFLNNGGFSH